MEGEHVIGLSLLLERSNWGTVGINSTVTVAHLVLVGMILRDVGRVWWLIVTWNHTKKHRPATNPQAGRHESFGLNAQ
jgi:hypothetical protein